IGALSLAGPSRAQLLWYNGDFDGNNGLANERNTSVTFAAVYDDFIVPIGDTWNVTGLFSNDLSSIPVAVSADYEIRSGVSTGNGGTLLFSGTGVPVITTTTGRTGFGLTEKHYLVSAAL